MSPQDRRDFLKRSAAGVAGSTLLGGLASAAKEPAAGAHDEPLPPHVATELPGVHAYAEKSIAAGEAIHFRVSSTLPYRFEVVRLAGEVDDDASDEVLVTQTVTRPDAHPVHLGSYVHVERALPAEEKLAAVTLECWVRVWRDRGRQGILTQYDSESAGIGLFVGEQGEVQVALGDGTAERDEQLVFFPGVKFGKRSWQHIVATWDGKTVTLYLDGRVAGRRSHAGIVRPGRAPLRLAAFGEKGLATGMLDGDLAMPVLYDRALSEAEVAERTKQRGLVPATGDGVLACWPLSEEDGETIADVGGAERSGRIINHATWMIGGPSFPIHWVGRYDAGYDPTRDGQRGHALRFCSDDLFDCRWPVVHTMQIPETASSGVYVGRFIYDIGGEEMRYFVTFIVRRPESRPQAPILMICSTNTWLAYNCTPFPGPVRAGLHWGAKGVEGMPHFCCYANHRAGQPTYYLGRRVPWPGAGPEDLFSPPEVNYSHLMRGELFTHRWLDGVYDDTARYEYDVVGQEDIDRDPELLKGYKTIIVNGHSEYWSTREIEGIDKYLSEGGTAIIMSGNTMFWRVSFNDDYSVMECRKYDPRIGGRGGAMIGELYHSDDKKRGSLIREAGYPEFEYIGLSCIGWDRLDRAIDYGVYYTETPDHFLFNEPEKVGLKKDETFGHAPGGGLPRAVGHEWDVRLPTLKKATHHIPQGARLPDREPEGIVTLANGIRPAGGGVFDYFTAPARTEDGISAELIYWERPQGGRVLHFGAIAIGWALSVDRRLGALVRNVLAHFDVPRQDA